MTHFLGNESIDYNNQEGCVCHENFFHIPSHLTHRPFKNLWGVATPITILGLLEIFLLKNLLLSLLKCIYWIFVNTLIYLLKKKHVLKQFTSFQCGEKLLKFEALEIPVHSVFEQLKVVDL